jgi:glycosyltransferase 2 family protein
MRNWRLWLGVVVSAACLYLAARGVDWASLREALRQVQVAPLLLGVGLSLWIALARAYRWRTVLAPFSEPKIGRLFNLLNAGYFVSNVAPFRIGDVLRAYLCAELEQLSVVRVLSTVVVERILDTLTIVILLLALVPVVSLPASLLRPALGVGSIAVLAMLVLVVLAWRRQQVWDTLGAWASQQPFVKRLGLERLTNAALDGMAALGSWRQVTKAGAWSMAIWLSAAVEFNVMLHAAGLRLPASAGLLVLCLTSLGMVVPSSPGYVGVFEYLAVLALSLYGVSREGALSYALILHGMLYLSSSVLGLLGLWIEGFSYARLKDVVARAQNGHSVSSSKPSGLNIHPGAPDGAAKHLDA